MHTEVKVATMLVQHNIPLASDEIILLFHDTFPDSEIAKQFSSKRTKAACIINGAIASFYQQMLVDLMDSLSQHLCHWSHQWPVHLTVCIFDEK